MNAGTGQLKLEDFLAEVRKKADAINVYQTIELPGLVIKGSRKYPAQRLKIFDRIDLKGKRVFDLGCANGFMSLELAKRGAKVTGYDIKVDRLDLARYIADYYKLQVDFKEATITEDFLEGLEQCDVVVFLSVIHHLFKRQKKDPIGMCRRMIHTLSKKCSTLYFEMGQNGEPFPWAVFFNHMGQEPKNWILENFFEGSEFNKIDVIEGPLFDDSWIGRLRKRIVTRSRQTSLHYPLYRIELPRQWLKYAYRRLGCLINSILYRILITDPRDTRYIFIAQKVSENLHSKEE